MGDINDEISEAFTVFCQAMSIDSGKWNSALEFAIFADPKILFLQDAPMGYPALITDIRAKMQKIVGPHGPTLLQVYRVNRRRPLARLKTPFLKLLYLMAVFIMSLKLAWKDRAWP